MRRPEMATDQEKMTPANPLGRKSNPHFYRDPAKRGKIAARKVRNGRLKNNPYQPGPKHEAWKNAFEAAR